ncbi:MAG: ATP synthase subunit I [Candidatus Methanoperedens sp.]|nr:ATP synthase subunit I [Candidatus Methanoperedens sp.]
MNDLAVNMFSLAAGVLFGIFYFHGLWLTLKKLPNTGQPVLLTMGSFLGRTALCILGFYLVTTMVNLEGLILSIIGFTASKITILHLRSGGIKSWK